MDLNTITPEKLAKMSVDELLRVKREASDYIDYVRGRARDITAFLARKMAAIEAAERVKNMRPEEVAAWKEAMASHVKPEGS